MFLSSTKIFYHYDRIKDYIEGNLVLPVSVKLRLTDRCNLKCYYCSYKDRLSADEMSYSDFSKILVSLKNLGVKSIVFTGGEPTVCEYLKDAVKMAREMGFDLALITNGVNYVNVEEELEWIRFSVDSLDSKQYKRMKGKDCVDSVKNTIYKTLSNKRRKATVGIQAVLNGYNFDYQFNQIRDLINFSRSVEADYFQLRPLENEEYDKEQLVIIKDNIQTLKKEDLGINIVTTDYKWSMIGKDKNLGYSGCPSADFIGSIDVNGDFYMCCSMIYDKTALYGNLLKDTVSSILENRKYIQKNFDYRKCSRACQGALLNKTLYDFKRIEHRNFV